MAGVACPRVCSVDATVGKVETMHKMLALSKLIGSRHFETDKEVEFSTTPRFCKSFALFEVKVDRFSCKRI